MTDWIVRPYRPSDEGFVVYSWLTSHGESRYARDLERIAVTYWDRHRPVVLRLLTDVAVLCDPETQDVILGWAAFGGADVLHYALCKRSLHKAGLAAGAFGALLGERLARAQRVTHELVDLKLEQRIRPPATWVQAPYAILEAAA